MYPSFTSLSQRERKRQELLREAERELAIDRHLKQRYAETMWAADNESSLITLSPATVSSSVQTTTTTTSTPATATTSTTATSTPTPTPIPTATATTSSVFSPEDSERAQMALNDANIAAPEDSERAQMAMNDANVASPAVAAPATAALSGEQYASKSGVEYLIKTYPEILLESVNPIFLPSSQRRRRTYYFGKNARLVRTNDNRPLNDADNEDLALEIDWIATENYMRSRLQAIGKLQDVIGEVPTAANRVADLDAEGRKTALRDTFNTLIANKDYVDTEPAEALIDSHNERWYKSALRQIISMNLDTVNKYGVSPVGKDGSILTGYQLDKISLALRQNGLELSRTNANKVISWEQTLREFLRESARRKVQLDIPAGLNIRYYGADRKHRLADSTISNAPDSSKPKLTEEHFHSLVKSIFEKNPYLIDKKMPKYSPTGKDKIENDYVFGANAKLLMRSTSKPLNKNQEKRAMQAIAWEPTYYYFVNMLIDHKRWLEKQPSLTPDGMVAYDGIKSTLSELGFKSDKVVSRKVMPDLGDPDFGADNSQMSLDELEEKAPAVVGKGLRGAGYKRKEYYDNEGNLIKYHSNRGYNLAQLEASPIGQGTMSAMAYKRVGTKFVHLPKLNEGLLKVVYPNRSVVGSQRKISNDLAELIKKLVFDGEIDQRMYDSLDIDDKRVFHELLRITHTQHAMRDPLKDPRDVLKQEYTKLKGELMLGNDNPAIIRELKQVLVDMYSAKLISDKEFKEVLLAIV